MVDAAERLINLALFFASRQGTVTADEIQREVYGYPTDQDDVAFKRMLERDKDALRSSGFALISDDEGNYRLDKRATYIGPLSLSADEAAAVRAAATALAGDPSFPFADNLRLALAKMSDQVDALYPEASSVLADEDPRRQCDTVAALVEATSACKRVRFDYTNSMGTGGPHEVEPYGLFLHAGRWYLVGRDTAKSEVRTYAAMRVENTEVNSAAPKTPDFSRPEGFDVSSFVRMPFQYGPERDEFEATVRFSPPHARKARALATNGELTEQPDGSVVWKVYGRSMREFARFIVENGPGVAIESPPEAATLLTDGLREVEALHG